MNCEFVQRFRRNTSSFFTKASKHDCVPPCTATYLTRISCACCSAACSHSVTSVRVIAETPISILQSSIGKSLNTTRTTSLASVLLSNVFEEIEKFSHASSLCVICSLNSDPQYVQIHYACPLSILLHSNDWFFIHTNP